MNNSKRRRFYSRLRNGKLEGRGGIPRPHIFDEEKKEIWVFPIFSGGGSHQGG